MLVDEGGLEVVADSAHCERPGTAVEGEGREGGADGEGAGGTLAAAAAAAATAATGGIRRGGG